ncbi:retron Ec48 family effector membrane protein [Oceanisphaera psychrotolerans]|uniref:retron Ec48 family effector membrane protein n=1 Tax=Oceanisphaera psychrotolerans TaxID=1414654 RepID=UPI0009F44783|nr:retron Ec48 family effector membrane protein [Oceanisphaera psychrotolerans]
MLKMLRKIKLIPFVVYSFVIVVLVSLLLMVTILYTTIYNEKMYLLEFCFTNECVLYTNKKLSAVIKVFNATISILTSIATVGGIAVAVKSYLNVTRSNALNNHIAHFKIFQDYIDFEVKKRDRLLLSAIDTFKWYNLIFKRSRSGSMNVSDEYVEVVTRMNNEILSSNKQAQSATEGSYRYKEHQKRISGAVSFFGINLSFHPRNDFYEIETQMLDLISTVNKAFCTESLVPEIEKRKYI